MTPLEKAFDEWLLKQGGVNGSVNVRDAFEAGAKAALQAILDEAKKDNKQVELSMNHGLDLEAKLKIAVEALEIIRDSNHGKDCDLIAYTVASFALEQITTKGE